MTRSARRILITLIALAAALGVVLAILSSPRSTGPGNQSASGPTTAPAPDASASVAATQPESDAGPAALGQPAAAQPATAALPPLQGLRASAPPATSPPGPPVLGSLDPRRALVYVELTARGAGIERITYSDIWTTVKSKLQAERYFERLGPTQPIDTSQLPADRYVLDEARPFIWDGGSVMVPLLATYAIEIDGTRIGLLEDDIWVQTGPTQFTTRIEDEGGNPILEIVRRFELGAAFEIQLHQHLRNLSGRDLQLAWWQYGPPEIPLDPGYIEVQRFAFGYLPGATTTVVVSDDENFVFSAGDFADRAGDARDAADAQRRRELSTVWPNRRSVDRGYVLSWFAATNRYFGLAAHPMLDAAGQGSHAFHDKVDQIRVDVSAKDLANERVVTYMLSPTFSLAPGAMRELNMGIYAGPLDRSLLKTQPYDQLSLRGLVRYEMPGCCTFLTFQWLANLLMLFLSALHVVVRDWGVAIIGLVVFVRALLHPLTKKAQVNMTRFGKQMAAMKPEIEKIQKKYAGDPKKTQQEQMRLMREHGMNPLKALGCLPMFLQMPIWIALWAMLYLAFELRQEPAFWGVFQQLGDWTFLADLSSQDSFITLPGGGFTLPLFGTISALNLLPLLMGLVFYFQQKYMSPPPTPNMTPEQIQQQKIMKWMMVIMFPLFLYKAPCGLTLYIFTSTCIGIIESRYVRKHIADLEANPRPETKKPSKIKDLRARLFAEALERAKARRSAVPPKSFKRRK